MQPDYQDAAERHWEDAGYLMADNRIANADHLFGLSAEFGLKAIMIGLGMQMNPRKPDIPEDPYAVHIDRLWDEFITFAQSRNGARYATVMGSRQNPFSDWDVAQRYCHRSDITNAILENHRQGALTTRKVLNNAVLEGVI